MAASAPLVLVLAITGPIARSDLPGLCNRVCVLLQRSRAPLALVGLGGVQPDAVTVDALARLQVVAQRHGCQLRLRNASAELLELRDLMGLADVLAE
jgi:ABC-type transporter Mla MlaB component